MSLLHNLHYSTPQTAFSAPGTGLSPCSPGRGDAALPLTPQLRLADLAWEREAELPVPFSIQAGTTIPKLTKHSSYQYHTNTANPPPPGKGPLKGGPRPPPGRPASPATADGRHEGRDSLPPSHRTLPRLLPGRRGPSGHQPQKCRLPTGPDRPQAEPRAAASPQPSPGRGRGPRPVRAGSARPPRPEDTLHVGHGGSAALRPARWSGAGWTRGSAPGSALWRLRLPVTPPRRAQPRRGGAGARGRPSPHGGTAA